MKTIKTKKPNITQAMILAAGLGTRMGNLTQQTPKPLLQVRKQPLISYHLTKLAQAGITDCVINTHLHEQKFHSMLGDGSSYGLRIHYSHETDILGTAGGIVQALALALLQPQPFLLVNGDVFTDYDFKQLTQQIALPDQALAHLVLATNPDYHPGGDFHLNTSGRLTMALNNKLTYTGIGLFYPELFNQLSPGFHPLGGLLRHYIATQQIRGEQYSGLWLSVDTPERLALAEESRCY